MMCIPYRAPAIEFAWAPLVPLISNLVDNPLVQPQFDNEARKRESMLKESEEKAEKAAATAAAKAAKAAAASSEAVTSVKADLARRENEVNGLRARVAEADRKRGETQRNLERRLARAQAGQVCALRGVCQLP